MSLGFLTESALVPSKAKPIAVDAKSLVDLKAVVFQKDQERQRRLRDALEADGDGATGGGRNLARYAHLRGKSRKRAGAASLSKEEDRIGKRGSNRGVDKRRRRDEESAELDKDSKDDDEAWARKSESMLQKKAELYDQMMNGRVKDAGVASAMVSESLVDFAAKRSRDPGRAEAAQPVDETVEITDEFGRTRRVASGSPEHLRFLEASKPKEVPTVAEIDESGVESSDRREGGSFVSSQWDHRLKSAEKSYLQQVHERASLAKAATAVSKQSKKQLRLEKLRQERARAAATDGSLTAANAPSRLANDEAVSAQATDFLNQLSSLM